MHTYSVYAVDQITPSTLLVTLQGDAARPSLSFQPGQYAAISYIRGRRPSIARCFSIVSSPTQQGMLQFSMRTRGRFTHSLTGLRPGDTVKVRGPYGAFVFDTHLGRSKVFIAGGIGITPFISMCRYAASTHALNEIRLIYSCATQDDVPFIGELQQLALINPHFKVTFVIGSGPIDKLPPEGVMTGRVTAEVIDTVIGNDYGDPTFYICGPPPFMKAVAGTLKDKGVDRKRILTEAFSQGPNRQSGKVRDWPFNMYAMTAAGVAVVGLMVMINDLLKALPPAAVVSESKFINNDKLINSRQQNLDALVNRLPSTTPANSPSDQLAAAQSAAGVVTPGQPSSPAPTSSNSSTKVTTVTTPVASTSTGTKTTVVSPSPTPSPTPTPTPTPSPSPTPTPSPSPTPSPTPTPPAPVCHTTQSGVKVCN